MSSHGNSTGSIDPDQISKGNMLASGLATTINTRQREITQKREEQQTAEGEALQRLNRELDELERQQTADRSTHQTVLDNLAHGLTPVPSTVGSSKPSVSAQNDFC